MTADNSEKKFASATPREPAEINDSKAVPEAPCSDAFEREHVTEENYVKLPDLFSSIMAVEPKVNQHYFKVKPAADAWIAKLMRMDEKSAARNTKGDFCYLSATWVPQADEEALRMIVDWNSWIFLFDDLFDEGHLSQDPVAAQAEIDGALAVMEDTNPPVRVEEDPIRYVFQIAWDRFKKRSSPELRQRYKKMHQLYFNGLLEQVKLMHEQRPWGQTESEYLEMRRKTIGGYPVTSLQQYANGIELPDEVFEHPVIQEIMRISLDLVILVNDILSYKKDLALGVDHNLINIMKKQGFSTQQGMDRIGALVEECYKRWYAALGSMPIWGEKIDREVLKFVEGCRNLALGNLYWSFKTGRYLGAEGQQVYETRVLHLPPSSP